MNSKNISLLPFSVLEKQEPQWALSHINVFPMWKRGYTGDGAVVAILDTGCNYDHPFIRHSIIGGMNLTTDYAGVTSQYMDNNGHGTHICGIVSARYNRKNGMSGVAPDAKLLVFKVLNSDGTGEISPILKAMTMAVNWRGPGGKRVNVIGMSFGTEQNYPQLEQAINTAVKNNILVITAAGNDGDGKKSTNEIIYPGYYDSVLQVGASDINDGPAGFSNSNRHMDIVAPGVDILSLGVNGGYTVMSGTSMACPHVVGGAALIISYFFRNYGYYPTVEQIVHILRQHARRLNFPRNRVGWGLLDLDIF